MDKEIRLGRFDKWGYKNSFSKGELARELTYMNRDYDKLEQKVQKQKEVIDKIEKYIEKQARMYGLSMPIELGTHLDNILGILNEVSE